MSSCSRRAAPRTTSTAPTNTAEITSGRWSQISEGVRAVVSNGGAMGRPQQPLEHRLLLTATFCLLAGGAVMVYSASSARTLLEGEGDGTAYLVKYLLYGGVGLIAMQVLSRHGLAAVRRLTPVLLVVAFLLLVVVLLPGIGVRVNGARRWLGAGPLQFQPSEIMKLALVLHTAAVIAARPKIARSLRLVVVPVVGVAGVAALRILGQPRPGAARGVGGTRAAGLGAP